MDFCKECSKSEFVYDYATYDRICTYCGLCTAYELSDIHRDANLYIHVSSYDGETYFRTVVNKAIMAGLDISHTDKEWVVAQYRVLAGIFVRSKAHLGRKSFPGYNYIFSRILEMRGVDGACIKIPKLQKTRARMDETWAGLKETYDRAVFRINPQTNPPQFPDIDVIDYNELMEISEILDALI